jgi:hypothetical protein
MCHVDVASHGLGARDFDGERFASLKSSSCVSAIWGPKPKPALRSTIRSNFRSEESPLLPGWPPRTPPSRRAESMHKSTGQPRCTAHPRPREEFVGRLQSQGNGLQELHRVKPSFSGGRRRRIRSQGGSRPAEGHSPARQAPDHPPGRRASTVRNSRLSHLLQGSTKL